MFLPLGDTGVGKMGEMPPTSHELRKRARPARESVVRSARALLATSWKYIDARNPTRSCVLTRPDRIQTDCGRSPKAPLRRCVQSQPLGRVSALWACDRPFRRPLPKLRIQAVAVQRGRRCGIQALAPGRPEPCGCLTL